MSSKRAVLLKAFYGVLTLVTLLLLAYVVYRRPLYPTWLFLTYLTLGLCGLITWVLLMRGPRERQLNVALLLCTTGIGLYVAEGVLGLWTADLQDLRQREAERRGITFDTRTTGEVVASLQEAGQKAYWGTVPGLFSKLDSPVPLFPLGTISDATFVNCNENGFYQIYTSDRYGFRNPSESWMSDSVDIVLAGDLVRAREMRGRR